MSLLRRLVRLSLALSLATAMGSCDQAEMPHGLELELADDYEVLDPEPSLPDSCYAGETVCLGPSTIEACIDGVVERFDCGSVCQEQGFLGADGCNFDAEIGVDSCYCVNAPSPELRK